VFLVCRGGGGRIGPGLRRLLRETDGLRGCHFQFFFKKPPRPARGGGGKKQGKPAPLFVLPGYPGKKKRGKKPFWGPLGAQ